MKHFFDQTEQLDKSGNLALIQEARAALKKIPMNVADMKTKMGVMCFNASAVNEYLPSGLEDNISIANYSLETKIQPSFIKHVQDEIDTSGNEILAYIFANVQTKEIEAYLNFCFKLEINYAFDSNVIFHFANDELIDYLMDFLSKSKVDKIPRKIEVLDNRHPTPWKIVDDSKELLKVDKGLRAPIILDRAFFTEIHLNIKKNQVNQVFAYPIGKLNSVLGHFNKKRAGGGMVMRATNKLYLKWSDIAGFKLASTQSKILQGLSYMGELIASNQIMAKNINLNVIEIGDIDFFRFRVGGRSVDVKPEELVEMEVNLDNQQIMFTRGVGQKENHVSRFNQLVLYQGNQSVHINKIVPFNRGDSNFNLIQTFLGARYTEFEKAREIRKYREELDLLTSRNIMSGDMMSQMVLSSMNLLGVLPLKARCIGLKPEHVKNQPAVAIMFKKWFSELKEIFADIIDISNSPQFNTHNFERLLKNVQNFTNLEDVSSISSQLLKDMTDELEGLIQYMDDFFKLNIYSQFNEDLECETISEENSNESIDDLTNVVPERIDESTRDFIGENFLFFQKRSKIQSAILKIERVLFYNEFIKPYAEKKDFEPGLIVYQSSEALKSNYIHAGFPALALSDVLNPDIFKSGSEDEDLFFVKKMNEFTQKVHQKSLSLNQTFHHQYKHTISELRFISLEKLQHLQEELAFLENPENKEKAYIVLLEKITKLYQDHLQEKQDNIDGLKNELKVVEQKIVDFCEQLEEALQVSVNQDNLPEIIDSMPKRMEQMRAESMKQLNTKKPEISTILLPFSKFYGSATNYFSRILNNANLFQKALLVRKKHQMYVLVKKKSHEMYKMEPEQLGNFINSLKSKKYDADFEKKTLTQINKNSRQLNDAIRALTELSIGDLFQDKTRDKVNLGEYLAYFKAETEKLCKRVERISTVFKFLHKIESAIFKQLEMITTRRTLHSQNLLLVKTAELIYKDPDNQNEVEKLLEPSEKIPTKIKDELSGLRNQMNQTYQDFNRATIKENQDKALDFKDLIGFAERREHTNFIAKELVNFTQGVKSITAEVAGEEEDLKYMSSQESNLEKVAMSKAMPSTRTLLKTQYIPLVEKEISMLDRANNFLGEIISNDVALKNALNDTYFRKRYGYQQFTKGIYCIDNERGSRSHTEKNISSAMLLLSDKFSKGILTAVPSVQEAYLKKVIVKGMDGIKERIKQNWQETECDRFIIIPASLTTNEVIDLCDFKAQLIKDNPILGKSNHHLILIYINQIDFNPVKNDPNLLIRYHQAVLSNIFINIDGLLVFNNRQSIFEACVKELFSNSNEKASAKIAEALLVL
ncbi:MAG: hypothetical protein HOD92_07885 [Deltaproteobacteria bacterium]|nr:hypothetical protein [Deltaproteobacteria bacterium]